MNQKRSKGIAGAQPFQQPVDSHLHTGKPHFPRTRVPYPAPLLYFHLRLKRRPIIANLYERFFRCCKSSCFFIGLSSFLRFRQFLSNHLIRLSVVIEEIEKKRSRGNYCSNSRYTWS